MRALTALIMLLCLPLLSSCNDNDSPESINLSSLAMRLPSRLIAHRGLWNVNGSAQNSLQSIRLACENPHFKGAEIDIWQTADKQLVLSHDGTIDNMEIDKTVYDKIKGCRLANGERIPTFEAALDLIAQYPGKILMIDIKRVDIDVLMAAIEDYGYPERLYFKSFGESTCRALAENDIRPVYYLTWDIGKVDIAECIENGYDGVSAYCKPVFNDPGVISRYHTAGLEFIAWNAYTTEEVECLLTMGVDIVVTDLVPRNSR